MSEINRSELKISRCELHHTDAVAVLFDKYRQFYEMPADLPLAKNYVHERIKNSESIIFVAEQPSADDQLQAVGFTQLYPSFCSVEAIKIFILYDLFVDETARQGGVGRKLMLKASEFAAQQGAKRVDLLTAHSNKKAQALYESLGYVQINQDFHAYSLAL